MTNWIEKLVRPPVGPRITLKIEPTSILPGCITYVTEPKAPWPLFPWTDRKPIDTGF